MLNAFKNAPKQNHHHESVSTSPQFFARQFFLGTDPISDKHYMSNYNQYCAYTLDKASILLALRLIADHDLKHEVHIQRTRFWVLARTELDTYCALRFKCVNDETDHALGT